jgi:hypothetical protein
LHDRLLKYTCLQSVVNFKIHSYNLPIDVNSVHQQHFVASLAYLEQMQKW